MTAGTAVVRSGTAATAFVRRHQLAAFVVAAYAFSWWARVWYRVDPVSADAPILPYAVALCVPAGRLISYAARTKEAGPAPRKPGPHPGRTQETGAIPRF